MTSVRLALFTDSAMLMEAGDPRPIRDQFVHFAKHLASDELELTIISRARTPIDKFEGMEPLELSEQLRFVPLPYYANTREFYRRLPGVVFRSWSAIRRECVRADIVCLRHHHCMAPWIWSAARLAEIPLTIYWAGPPITESAKRNHPAGLKGFVARRVAAAEQLFAYRSASTAVQHFFVDRDEWVIMGRPDPKAWVVPTLISESALPAAPPLRSHPGCRFLFAGRVARHKGVYDLLTAFERLADVDSRVTLMYVGHGEELEALRETVGESRHVARIEIAGGLSRSELADVMRSHDVLCLPSYAEGLPKVMWEAWSAGMALLISDVGSIRYFVEDGLSGLMFEPGNATALDAAMTRVAADAVFRRSLGSRGLEMTRKHTREAATDHFRRVIISRARGERT